MPIPWCGWSARRRMTPALAAMSRRSGLKARITRILMLEAAIDPRPGRIWSGIALLCVLSLAATVALAQTREMKSAERTRNVREQQSSRDPATDRRPLRRTIWGEVRDPAGKPVGGASIVAVGLADPGPPMVDGQPQPMEDQQKILGQAVSSRAGRFQLELRAGPEVHAVDLIARGTDSGLTGANFSIRPDGTGQMRFPPFGDEPITLTLPSSIPIEGQLLSPSGRPVSGALIEMVMLGNDRKAGRGKGWYVPTPEPGRDRRPNRSAYWPEPVLSDGLGRFRMGGYSEGALAEITVKHEEYIHEALIITTANEVDDWYTERKVKPLPPRFSHVLEPSRAIEGTVTDKDTSQPVEGVSIDMYVARPPDWRFHFTARSDAHGRYRIRGVGWNRPQVLFANINSATSGYLPFQENRQEWPVGARDLVWNFAVKRGQVVRGTVIDAGTGKPIAGARIAPGSGALTDRRGNFAMAMPPGRQIIFVEAPTPDYQRVTIPRGVASPFYIFYPHGFAKVDIKPGQAAEPLEITLKKGASIAAQAVDTEGKAVADVWVSGLSLFAELDRPGQTAGHYANGLFRMSSFVPGQTYRIFFIQNERRLACFADITPTIESQEPVRVSLRPLASVRGKLLKLDGSPRSAAAIDVELQMARQVPQLGTRLFLGGDEIMSYGLAGQRGGPSTRTNNRGEFVATGLVPGVKNYLVIENSGNRVEYVPIDPLAPGEVRDLGDVKPTVFWSRTENSCDIS